MQVGLLNTAAGAGPSLNVPLCRQIRGCLGANAVSGVAAGTGVGILISNLKQSATYVYGCEEVYVNDNCSLACFSTVCISHGKAETLVLI